MKYREMMDQLQKMKDEVKRRSMIFDVGEREYWAIKLGFPVSHFHEMSCKDWIEKKKELSAIQPLSTHSSSAKTET